MGITSIGFIGSILFMTFYIFGIVGIILFKENDPWHFKNCHTAMISLFRMATMEDWTDIMYINMYGCDVYGYDTPEMVKQCTTPKPRHLWASIYFILFIIVGSLIILTLFIGVVTTSMEEAADKQNEERDIELRVKQYMKENKIPSKIVEKYREVFHFIDIDEGGTVDLEELHICLRTAGIEGIDISKIKKLMDQVDADNSGSVDFAEFLAFMYILQHDYAQKKVPRTAVNLKRMMSESTQKVMSTTNNKIMPEGEDASIDGTSVDMENKIRKDRAARLLLKIKAVNAKSKFGIVVEEVVDQVREEKEKREINNPAHKKNNTNDNNNKDNKMNNSDRNDNRIDPKNQNKETKMTASGDFENSSEKNNAEMQKSVNFSNEATG